MDSDSIDTKCHLNEFFAHGKHYIYPLNKISHLQNIFFIIRNLRSRGQVPISPVGSGVLLLIFRAIGGGWLSVSTEVLARTPPLHQTRLLRVPFTRTCVPDGCLFLGAASDLDAFSPYPTERGCPACLIRQPVNYRLQRLVPLVLKALSPQTSCTPSR